MDATDQALLEQWARARDEQAFQTLVSRYASLVYGTCRRLLKDSTEAEDVAQECFESLALRPQKAPVRHLGAWLHRHATYRSLDRLRSERRRRKRENEAFDHQSAESCETTWDDIYDLVDEAVEGLPDRLRLPIIRHFMQDKSAQEIADAAGVTRQTIHNRINEGIERIRRHMARRDVMLSAALLAALVKANISEAAPPTLIAKLGRLSLAGPAVATPLALAPYAKTFCTIAGAVIFIAGAVFIVYVRENPANVDPRSPQAAVEMQQAQQSAAPAASQPTPQKPAQPSSSPLNAGLIHGLVLFEDGSPAPNVSVAIEDEEFKRLAETTSDAAGYFRFEHVPLITARRTFKQRLTYYVTGATGTHCGCDTISASHYARESYVEILMYEDQPIMGKVVDAAGNPVPGATVRARLDASSRRNFDPLNFGKDFPCSENADFCVKGVIPGMYSLHATAVDYYQPTPDAMYATGAADVVLTLAPACAIKGRAVIAGTGEPAAGARIGLLPTERDCTPAKIPRESVGQDGAFAFRSIPPCTYRFHERCVPYVFAAPPEDVALSPGETREVVLQVERAASLSGLVFDAATGATMADCLLKIRNERTDQIECEGATDAGGNFTMDGLSGGPHTIEAGNCVDGVGVRLLSTTAAKVTLTAGRHTDGFKVPFPATHINGIVVDETGAPVKDASVMVGLSGYSLDAITRTVEAAVLSDAAGKFSLLVPTETNDMTIQAYDGSALSVPQGPFDSGDGRLDNLTLTLAPSGRIEGRVVDNLGASIKNAVVLAIPARAEQSVAPMPGARMEPEYMRDLGTIPGPRDYTRVSGNYILSPLLPGAYTLTVFLPSTPADAPAASIPVTVVGGQTQKEDITVNTADLGSIEGIVTRRGTPSAGLCVQVSNEPRSQFTWTDSEGKYRFEYLRPGKVSVMLMNLAVLPDTATEGARFLMLEPGQTLKADFALDQGAASAEGTVTINGAPVPNMNINFEMAGDAGSTYSRVFTRTDSTGKFHADRLLPGACTVSSSATSEDVMGVDDCHVMREVEIELHEGANHVDLNFLSACIKGKLSGLRDGEEGRVAIFQPDAELPDMNNLAPGAADLLRDLAVKQGTFRDETTFVVSDIEPGDYIIAAAAIPRGFDSEVGGPVRHTLNQISINAGEVMELSMTIE